MPNILKHKPQTPYQDVEYVPVKEEALEGEVEPKSGASSTSSKRRVLLSSVLLLAVTLAGAGVTYLIIQLQSPARCSSTTTAHTHTSSSPSTTTAATPLVEDCGSSSAEAISRGCKMEPTIYGWVPPQCFYPELSAEYPIFTDRKWFRDANMTEQLTVRELETGKYNTIYTDKFHTIHCLFMWRKLAVAVHEQREWVDNKTVSVHHAAHCTGQMLGGWEGDESVNEAALGTYKCARLDWAR